MSHRTITCERDLIDTFKLLREVGYPQTLQWNKGGARSLDQNAKMWAMLSDVSIAKPEGRRHTPEDWKAIFMNACNWEVQFIEGLDGRPFPSGFRSSRLNKSQMADLITFISAYGDEHGVVWTDPKERAQ
tara:strand:- start:5037 stop:5426 length:390 start_codon:yes stop_codon:yes gene_type:complete